MVHNAWTLAIGFQSTPLVITRGDPFAHNCMMLLPKTCALREPSRAAGKICGINSSKSTFCLIFRKLPHARTA